MDTALPNTLACKAVFVLAALFGLTGCATTTSAEADCPIDPSREAGIELEATATLFDGTPVRIPVTTPGANDFLAIWTPGRVGKPVVVLAHGPQRNLSSPVISETALALSALGYGTLSLQLPVLKKSCEGATGYPRTFEQAFGRIDAAAGWLQSKGVSELVLFGHWIGNEYLAQTNDAPFKTWIVNGLTGNFRSIGDNSPRILDIYGSQGNKMTLRSAWLRRLWLSFGKDGRQVVIDGANHSFTGKYTELADAIDQFLSGNPDRN